MISARYAFDLLRGIRRRHCRNFLLVPKFAGCVSWVVYGFRIEDVVSGFLLRFIFSVFFIFALRGHSYADQTIYGCWNDIHQASVNPKYSPQHKPTTASGTIICFKNNGSITTVHVGGFEALGTEGRFSYRAGRLVLIKNGPADGWPFAFSIDRCNATVTTDQLTIYGCKNWEPSTNLTLHRQTKSPAMSDVAGGVFQ